MAKSQILAPDRNYLRKMRLIITMIAFAFFVGALLFSWLLSLDRGIDAYEAGTVATIIIAIDILFWIIGMALSGPYYRSLSYEIQDDEVIVRVGIITKSVKHVPYRTVTNIKINRGILDRYLFAIGTLNIQTAGMSGNTGAEESLVGLKDVQGIYGTVAGKLRAFRGAMSPTAADIDMSGHAAPADSQLGELLGEVKAIRARLERTDT